MRVSAYLLIPVLTLSVQFFALLEGNVTQNTVEHAHIYFTDRQNAVISMFVVEQLFILPSNYHCSSIKNPSGTEPSHLKTFLANCELNDFVYFLGSLHHLIMKFEEIHCNSKESAMSNHDSDSLLASALELPIDDFEFIHPILEKFSQNKEFLEWLKIYNTDKCNVAASNEMIVYFRRWHYHFKYIIAATFLSDFYFEINGSRISLTRTVLNEHEDKPRMIRSGKFGTCYEVEMHESQHCSCTLNRPILKVFNEKHSFQDITFTDFQEYFVFQKAQINETSRFSTAFSVVFDSTEDYTPIGYLMERFEFGDLEKFLLQRRDIVLSKYFMEELFELAKAINYLHKNHILHLDIRLNNFFVKSKQSTNSHDNYELILGEFGYSREIGYDFYFKEEFRLYAAIYPPDFFCKDSTEISVGTYSDLYGYGKLLNHIASIIKDSNEKRKFVFIFSSLINNLSISDGSKRWKYEKVHLYFENMLSSYQENLVCLSTLRWKDTELCKLFFEFSNSNSIENALSFIEEYISCQLEEQFLTVKPESSTIDMPNHLTGELFTIKIPIVYVFHKDFQFEIQMPQTNHERVFFHAGSFLIFQSDSFCYASFYNDNSYFCTVIAYNYDMIVDKINSIQKDSLFPIDFNK